MERSKGGNDTAERSNDCLEHALVLNYNTNATETVTLEYNINTLSCAVVHGMIVSPPPLGSRRF